MAVTFVGVSSSVEVATTAHALVTTGISGLAAGDLLVACISSRIASTTPVTLPTGGEWTLIGQQNTNNTATNTSATSSATMAYCVRGASNPNLTFTHPVAPSVALGAIVAYRGIATASPLDGTYAETSATNTTTWFGAGGVTCTRFFNLIVAMTAGGQEATWSAFDAATTPSVASGSPDTSTNPTADTWLERFDANTTTGADTSLGIFDGIMGASLTTGNVQVVASLGAAHSMVLGAFKQALALDLIRMPPMRPPR